MNPFNAFRKRHNLTQQEFATSISASQTLVSLVESGVRQVPAAQVLRIEALTGISRTAMRPDLYPAFLNPVSTEIAPAAIAQSDRCPTPSTPTLEKSMADDADRASELLELEEAHRLQARASRPQPLSLSHCALCADEIPEARRATGPGIEHCIDCQSALDLKGKQRGRL